MGQKLLSSWKQLFFETFVSIDLFGPKDMILSNAQYLSKNLVDTYNYSPTFVLLDKTGKKGLKHFFTGKFASFFSKICVVNNFLGPIEIHL